jgi:hypothetical protein
LIGRGWTEKEKVARKRVAEQDQVEDEKLKNITWNEGVKNLRYFLTYQAPDSIFYKSKRKEDALKMA